MWQGVVLGRARSSEVHGHEVEQNVVTYLLVLAEDQFTGHWERVGLAKIFDGKILTDDIDEPLTIKVILAEDNLK